jgi:predicted membrane-bound spermidine synthase
MSNFRKGSIAVVAGMAIMVGCFVWIYYINFFSEFNPFLLIVAVTLFIIGVVLVLWGSGKNP